MNGANGAEATLAVGVSVAGTTQYYGEFWVGCYCAGGVVAFDQGQGTVQVPALRLFLDVGTGFQQPGDDHLPQYVPGSNLDGTSVAVPANETVPIQTVRLIAAFVNAFDQIVPPPSGVTQATFELLDTSRFVGYAMNAGTSTEPDFALTSGPTANFAGNLASVDLGVFDYGGFTTARATAAAVQPAQIRIPRDGDNNWLPDGGWYAWAGPTYVADNFGQCGTAAACDEDLEPQVTGAPAAGTLGDGFTRFEEFRGFVIQNGHRRTNPGRKDLFVSSDVEVQTVDVGIMYAYPRLTTATHRVWTAQQADDAGMPPQYDAASRVINTNYQNSGAGGDIPHRVDQMVLVVQAFAFNHMNWWGCTILTTGTCAAANGVAPTNRVNRIEIDVPQLVQAATASGWNVLESARWIIGHEVGHGVNIVHGPPNVDSLMNEWLTAPPAGAWIHYTADDLAQIRLHDR